MHVKNSISLQRMKCCQHNTTSRGHVQLLAGCCIIKETRARIPFELTCNEKSKRETLIQCFVVFADEGRNVNMLGNDQNVKNLMQLDVHLAIKRPKW